jgi:S-formylglutathione hydrolase FrmB
MKKALVLLFVLSLVGYSAWAKLTAPWGDQKVVYTPAKKECGAVDELKYCVYTAVGGVNGDVIYHLHGRNLDENVWNDDTYFTSMIQQYWQRQNIKAPTVVSVSFGGVWLLSKKGKTEKSGLLETFLSSLATIESKIGVPKSRILLGESMGGLNVLVAGLSDSQKFSKIASLCPGLYLDSPFSPLEKLKEAIERTGADPKIVLGIVQLSKEYLADEKEWSEFNPLETVEHTAPSTKLYLSCGLYDAYGNFEGTDAFAAKAKKRGFDTTWHPLYGGHCAIDVASLGEFLAR